MSKEDQGSPWWDIFVMGDKESARRSLWLIIPIILFVVAVKIAQWNAYGWPEMPKPSEDYSRFSASQEEIAKGKVSRMTGIASNMESKVGSDWKLTESSDPTPNPGCTPSTNSPCHTMTRTWEAPRGRLDKIVHMTGLPISTTPISMAPDGGGGCFGDMEAEDGLETTFCMFQEPGKVSLRLTD